MALATTRESVSDRLGALVRRAKNLEEEGLPFPTDAVRESIELSLAEGDVERGAAVLRQAEALYTKAARDWMWVRELLGRADELKAIAERVGMDLTPLESRVGSPREQLRSAPLSGGSLERAAASASLALAILNDALPKYCVQEAHKLGASIRKARDRGEEVGDATDEFRRLLRALQEEQLPIVAQRLEEARRSVARIPSAPSVGPLPSSEEEEILLEARALARRLHRIKGKAKNAQSAARLVTQVRAALSEDRRFGNSEDEIEDLWSQVDRLSRERSAAGAASLAPAPDPLSGTTPPATRGPATGSGAPTRTLETPEAAAPRPIALTPSEKGGLASAPAVGGLNEPASSSRRRRREANP